METPPQFEEMLSGSSTTGLYRKQAAAAVVKRTNTCKGAPSLAYVPHLFDNQPFNPGASRELQSKQIDRARQAAGHYYICQWLIQQDIEDQSGLLSATRVTKWPAKNPKLCRVERLHRRLYLKDCEQGQGKKEVYNRWVKRKQILQICLGSYYQIVHWHLILCYQNRKLRPSVTS